MNSVQLEIGEPDYQDDYSSRSLQNGHEALVSRQ
jgi:hypothetical protein